MSVENSKSLSEIENAIDNVICSCVLNEDFDIDDLYIQDRIYLFLMIRLKSKGGVLENNRTCKHCKSQYISTVDLNKTLYKAKEKDIDYIISINDGFKLVLDFIKRKDSKKIYEESQKRENWYKNDSQKMFDISVLTLASSIKKVIVDGVEEEITKLEDKEELLLSLSDTVFLDIQKWIEKNDFGLVMKYNYTCPHCGKEEIINIDIKNVM